MSSDQKNIPANAEPKITPKEAQTLLTFLNRTSLQGNESETHAYLKSKLVAIVQWGNRPADGGAPELTVLEGAKGEVRH